MSGESSEESPKLTVKQQRFIDAYIGEARFNASEAARLAGYSAKSARNIGADLRKTPHVRTRIDELLAANTLAAPEILHELTDVAMRTLDDCIEVRAFGDTVSARMDANAKMKALELIGKHFQLFTDNVHQSGGVTVELVGVDVDKL